MSRSLKQPICGWIKRSAGEVFIPLCVLNLNIGETFFLRTDWHCRHALWSKATVAIPMGIEGMQVKVCDVFDTGNIASLSPPT